MSLTAWLIVLIAFAVPAVCFVFWWFIFGKRDDKRVLRELALFFGAYGLIVQTIRSLYYMEFGHYPVDIGWPQWGSKDISICLFIAFVCQLMWERRNAEKDTRGKS